MPSRRSILASLDHMVRWTGAPARVEDEVSGVPAPDRKHRPLRWMPLWAIAFSCASFVLSWNWPPTADLAWLVIGVQASLLVVMVGFYMNGPLGKPARDDDEREAALRKDAFLLGLGLLAGLNCLGQPIVLVLSHAQHWQTAHGVNVAVSALVLNATLLCGLPTLYASWNLPQLPKDDGARHVRPSP